MNREDILERISIDPNVCFGKPCIRGHRIWVSLILDLLAATGRSRRFWKTIPALKKQIIAEVVRLSIETVKIVESLPSGFGWAERSP